MHASQCQCSMVARVAVCALALSLVCVRAQSVYVEVSPHNQSDFEDIESRRTSQLARELDGTKHEILLLYTDYTAKAGSDLKGFLKNISTYADEAISTVGTRPADYDAGSCREIFENKLKKIELDAYRAASFSGENHHKFILGHMIVFRMHINKSEEYIRKCDRALHGCGYPCEAKPKVKRWKRLAAEEIHRIKDDIQHTRKSYKDLVAHAKRRLNHLRKQIVTRTKEGLEEYQKCLDGSRRA